MTIQNQIPKLIIGIIMVTLSFGIAGLLIDLMWASTYVVINVMHAANNNISVTETSKQLNNHALGFFDQTVRYGDQDTDQGFGGMFNLAQKGAGSVQETINSSFGQSSAPNEDPNYAQCETGDLICNGLNFVGSLANNTIQGLANIVIGGQKFLQGRWGELASDAVGGVLSGVLGFLVSWLLGGIAFFIIIILLLWNLFKLWIFLLKCYISILIDIIFAPFWIIGSLLPGSSSLGFTGWLKDLLGNLAVFPATIGVFLLAKLFVDIADSQKTDFFVPPLIGNFSGGIYTLSPLIALGFVLAAPHVAEGVKKSIKEKFSIDLSGAGESLKAAQGMGIAFFGTARKRLYYEHKNPNTGEKIPTGLLKTPITNVKKTFTDTFWESRVGRTRTINKVKNYLNPQEKVVNPTPPTNKPGGNNTNQDNQQGSESTGTIGGTGSSGSIIP